MAETVQDKIRAQMAKRTNDPKDLAMQASDRVSNMSDNGKLHPKVDKALGPFMEALNVNIYNRATINAGAPGNQVRPSPTSDLGKAMAAEPAKAPSPVAPPSLLPTQREVAGALIGGIPGGVIGSAAAGTINHFARSGISGGRGALITAVGAFVGGIIGGRTLGKEPSGSVAPAAYLNDAAKQKAAAAPDTAGPRNPAAAPTTGSGPVDVPGYTRADGVLVKGYTRQRQ